MKKRNLTLLLVLVAIVPLFLFGLLSLPASAATASGTVGNFSWTLEDTHLTISGSGAMPYSFAGISPWGKNVTELTLEEGITSITDGAFYGHTSLESVEIPEGVTYIGECAFEGCSSLKSIRIPSTVKSFGLSVFSNCESLSSIVVAEENPVFHSAGNCLIDTARKSLVLGCNNSVIPSDGSVTIISDGAFWGCKKLESLVIPASVTFIGYSAFRDLSGLASIEVEVGNTVYESAGNCLIYTAYKAVFLGCKNSVIPSDGSITAIGDYAFWGCTGLESIVIPNPVESVGSYAFAYCTGLTSITLPKTMTEMIKYSFSDCVNLKDVYYEGTAADREKIVVSETDPILSATWHYGACIQNAPSFEHCYDNALDADCNACGFVRGIIDYDSAGTTGDLTWYVKDGHLVVCGEGAMPDFTKFGPWGTGIKSVVIEDGVTSIGARAFYYCTSLESIEIPESVTSIGATAFAYCGKLRSIHLPEGITSIGNLAFRQCSALQSITLPNSLTTLGTSAFYFCTGMESATIGNSLKVIGQQAFAYCSGLQKITIPGSVTKINNSAFRDCTSLATVLMEDGVKTIGAGAFYNCTALANVYYEGEAANFEKITIKASNTALTSASFHAGICFTNGFSHAYSGETDADCQFCGRVRYDTYGTTGNLFWYVVDGHLTICGEGAMPNYEKFGPWGTYITSAEIKEGVTSIGARAFYYCTSLESVSLPDGLLSIGANSFNYCAKLVSINLPDSITTIGNLAFRQCSSLKSITLPNSLATIGTSLFYYCTDLRSVVIPNSVKEIGMQAFAYCFNLGEVVIPDSVETIQNSAFRNCSSLVTVTLGKNVSFIGAGAFYLCNAIMEVHYGSTSKDFAKITIKASNTALTSAEIHYSQVFRWPLPEATPGSISQYWKGAAHSGLDISVGGWANNGKIPALSIADGKVVRTGSYSDWGNLVVVDHGDGYQSYYAHLDSISVVVGQMVTQGQELGKIGATGEATTPHLHLVIYAPVGANGDSVRDDPMKYISYPA